MNPTHSTALDEKIRKIVNGLLGHDDGVDFGDDYHAECKREADEACAAIKNLVLEELEYHKSVDKIENLAINLNNAVLNRIAELTTKKEHSV